MKKIMMVLTLCLISVTVFCQEELDAEVKRIDAVFNAYGCKVENGTISMQKIVEIPGMTSQQLYNTVKNFVIMSYNSPNTVIQNDDHVGGHLTVKGKFQSTTCDCANLVWTGSGMEYSTSHILKFDVKEGRVRITVVVTSVEQKSGGNQYVPLTYIDYLPTQFYPLSRSLDVYSNNHYMNWYPKEGSLKQTKGFVHEGNVMLKILANMSLILNAAENGLTNVTPTNNDEW